MPNNRSLSKSDDPRLLLEDLPPPSYEQATDADFRFSPNTRPQNFPAFEASLQNKTNSQRAVFNSGVPSSPKERRVLPSLRVYGVPQRSGCMVSDRWAGGTGISSGIIGSGGVVGRLSNGPVSRMSDRVASRFGMEMLGGNRSGMRFGERDISRSNDEYRSRDLYNRGNAGKAGAEFGGGLSRRFSDVGGIGGQRSARREARRCGGRRGLLR